MENNLTKTLNQSIILNNKKDLSVSGTNKVLSLRPNLVQLDTNFGYLAITGQNIELVKLDDASTTAIFTGDIAEIKFMQSKAKEPFFRKLFK